MAKYRVPVSWITYAWLVVNAKSEEDAFRKAKKSTIKQYISQSFEIDRDCIEEVK